MDVRDAVERCQPGLYPEQTMLRRQLDAKDQKIKELEERFRRQLGTDFIVSDDEFLPRKSDDMFSPGDEK
jgi:hypothetical protein